MTEAQITTIRDKARQKRYKKPANKELNLENIRYSLIDICSECQDVEYFFEGGNDDLLEELIGGEDEAREFKIMFSALAYECEQMLNDLDDEWVPEFFDTFFASISDRSQSLLGYDTYEEDYFSLSMGYETEQAIKEAKAKMQRFTKPELIEGACQCFRIAVNYLSLKSRYEDLKASIDIIKQKNHAELDVLNHINELYEKADDVSDGFRYTSYKEVSDLDKLINNIDSYSQLWIQ